jgi:hypothetical protein
VKPNPVAFTVTKLRHESVIPNTAFGDSVRPSLASIFANVSDVEIDDRCRIQVRTGRIDGKEKH